MWSPLHSITALGLLLAPTFLAQELPLYPGPAPGSEDATWQEGFLPANYGKRRIFNVTRPTLTPYLAPNPNGSAIVVCPGRSSR